MIPKGNGNCQEFTIVCIINRRRRDKHPALLQFALTPNRAQAERVLIPSPMDDEWLARLKAPRRESIVMGNLQLQIQPTGMLAAYALAAAFRS